MSKPKTVKVRELLAQIDKDTNEYRDGIERVMKQHTKAWKQVQSLFQAGDFHALGSVLGTLRDDIERMNRINSRIRALKGLRAIYE